jgi:imidazolonepropionase-like amidohydrolase
MMAVKAGVTTIEHAIAEADDELFVAMREKGCILVPTLAILERLSPPQRFREVIKPKVKRAYDLGVRFACEGDTGTYPHGENVREFELMMERGTPLEDVLEMCTIGGWESCGGKMSGREFGVLKVGASADIIAVDGDPRVDSSVLRKVDFVMADGKVWKLDGRPIGFL